jgi:transposase-like protein
MPKAIPARFTNEEAARKHLERLLWPVGAICPHCTEVGHASRIEGGRKGLWFCNVCRKQFSVTVGTVFERSHVPLNTWLYANHLLMSSKKGISSHQLSRMLGVSYKTAWFMSHRIREGLTPAEGTEPPLGGEGVVVEADEAELGKSNKSRSKGRKHNLKFVSLVERGGRVRSRKITGKGKPISIEINKALDNNLVPGTVLHTDGSNLYRFTRFNATHEAVDHNKEFVREGRTSDKVHTNSAEGYFSVFKRGLVGTYQHMSEQHLNRYLAEFDFRMSHRAKLGFDDAVRADIALQGIKGKRLTYRRTNAAANA